MENLELRIFREVAKAGSISKAAENMCYVQSNITAHMRKLEQELNTVLLVRHNRGITLTKEGEKLLSYANSILDLMDQAKYEFQQDKLDLHIGATQTLAAYRLPQWLSRYQKQFPNVNVSVITDSQDQLIELLCKQTIECAFVERKYVSKQIHPVFSFDEELCIIAPPQSNEQMLKNSAIITNKIRSCPYRKILVEWAISQTSSAPQIMEFDTVDAIIRSVSLGMGISLLPYSAVSDRENIAIFKAPDMKSLNMNMVVFNNQQSKNVYDFLKIISGMNPSE
jgi:DNA-binding transcriptional LysR family regulator